MKVFLLFIAYNYISFDSNGKHTFTFTGTTEEISLKPGKYEIDIYGAQGGDGWGDGVLYLGYGGEGAFIHAEFYICSSTTNTYYVNVGEQGVANERDQGTMEGPNRGGWNGGGSGGQDSYWEDNGSGQGQPNDAPGGGGGATDIRMNSNGYQSRVIVAAGGSGAYWLESNPGGALCGLTWVSHLNNVCSDGTNTVTGNGKTCEHPDGQGAKGVDCADGPESGGGGGYCGGRAYSDCNEDICADSGSSYARECSSEDNYDNELCFFNVQMNVGGRKGDGLLIITRNWECDDANCLYCKNAANKCEKCKSGYYRHNGACVSSCPTTSYQVGIDCIDCSSSCKTCQSSPTKCTSCKSNYYLYNNKCYSQCPNRTTAIEKNCVDCQQHCYSCISSTDFCTSCDTNYYFYNNKCYSECSQLNIDETNSFYGKDLDSNQCKLCNVENCIYCENDYNICQQCSSLYYLNNNLNKCIREPTKIFSSSNRFSKSMEFLKTDFFSSSDHFTKSNYFSFSSKFSCTNKFTDTSKFTETNFFSESLIFTKSNEFTNSLPFSQSKGFQSSSEFTKSDKFTHSSIFSKSGVFSISLTFIQSNQFTNSNIFTESQNFPSTSPFSKSNTFSLTSIFTYSNTFTESFIFSESNFFTMSSQFTTPFVNSVTYVLSLSQTFVSRKSVSLSLNKYESFSFLLTFTNDISTYLLIRSFYFSYIPYIIQFMSPTYVPVEVVVEIKEPKNNFLTQEKLIGIICGSVSLFFIILAVIIYCYRKKYNNVLFINEEEDDDESSSNENIYQKNINTIDISLTTNNSLDNWL